MKNPNTGAVRSVQRGQSIAEFLVALAVLTPIFMAVTYAGRYGDLQMSATQASRYAAFQRAREPSTARLSDSVLADQMRTRFFADGDYLNHGHLQSDDSIDKLKKEKGQPTLWTDLGGAPLLTKPEKNITLAWGDAPIGTGTVTKAMDLMTKTASKEYKGGQVARVEVTLANKLDLISDSPKPLVIAAATAAAGDSLNSGGSKSTRDAAATIVPTAYIPGILTGLLEEALDLFEPEGPKIGCIKPDVVPGHRLEGGPANNSACVK
ncbi:MAG TPA: TadE family protein [Ideonella sp.]|uniref:TadE family protein n=1 Tax=Ideonella sp. TaxID=1929293 RepID=UPI002E32B8DD|nr:TadE family protein [Ideonella sp.]HEX5684669.1 TadE family protein [Ideonella sp.]